jgi:hypothetical protein
VDERDAVDVLLGAAAVTAGAFRGVVAPLVALPRRSLAWGVRISRVPVPDRLVAGLAERGGHLHTELDRVASRVFRNVVGQTVEAVLGVVDLTQLVRRHADLDALVREIDVDAVVDRVDVDAVAARLDLEAVVARVDVDEVVSRVDVNGVVSRVDVDAVASRMDLDAVVARVDPDTVAKRLDVDAVVSRVDVDAVLARLDLPAIAVQVIAAIDLPEIVREATGPAASEVVRGIRTEGVHADDAVARMVDRMLRRTRPGSAGAR